MICKAKQGMSFKGLAEYVTNELKGARIIASEGVCAVDVSSIVDSFSMQAQSGSTRIKKVVGHFALAWTSGERKRLTDDFMAQLAREFMEEMGYANTQYVVSVHEDTDHPHCHVVYNRVDNNGKALNDSFLKRRAHKACRALERKHGLSRADKSSLDKVKKVRLVGADKTKFEMKKAVVNASLKANSWSEFRELLEAKGIRISFRYSRSGDIKGIIFSDGERSYAGSKLHADCSLKNLDKQFGGELEKAYFGKEIPSESIVPVLIPHAQKDSSENRMAHHSSENQMANHSSEDLWMSDSAVGSASEIDKTAISDPSGDTLIDGNKLLDFLLAALQSIGGNESLAIGGGGSSADSGWNDEEKDREKNREHKPKFAPSRTNVGRPKHRR